MIDLFAADPWFLAAFALALLGTGLVAGVLAGLLGVGGGIVIVPVLFNLFPLLGVDESVRMHVAVGTSLATIIPTSIVSARAHDRRGSLDADLLRSLAPSVVVGVLIGAALGGGASSALLTLVFAVVAILVALNMALRKDGMIIAEHLPTGAPRQAIGGVIGGFSVLMGIGGGTLSVPILSAFNVPIHRAVGTAAALGLVIGVPGAIGFVLAGWGVPERPPGSLGYVNMIGFALIVPATMLMAPLGARLAHAINASWLRRGFALFLALSAARMFAAALG